MEDKIIIKKYLKYDNENCLNESAVLDYILVLMLILKLVR